MTRYLIVTSMAVAIISLCSCVQNNRPFWQGDLKRPNYSSTHTFTKLKSQDTESTGVIVVEFDDQGDFWDRTQLSLAIRKIQSAKSPLVVTYVHGWHNNADPKQDGRDLDKFKIFVQRLKNSHGDRHEVIGVYLGWRGESSNIPGLRQLTFWNRKEGADRVSDGSMGYAMHRVASAARKTSGGRSVLIGHSFGGRIVERVVAMNLIARNQSLGDSDFGSSILPADFIVLINPASESLMAKQIQIAIQATPRDKPNLVAIGSKNDTANGNLWPAGALLQRSVGLGLLKEPDRKYEFGSDIVNQRDFLTKTTTNNPVLFTHGFSTNRSNQDGERKLIVGDQTYYLQPDIDMDFRIPSRGQKSYGYWIFQVDENILSGHGNGSKTVFSDEMQLLVTALMQEANSFGVAGAARANVITRE